MFDSRMELELPANHPSMKNTSTQEGNYFSLKGNPAPTDQILPKGSKLEQAESDKLVYSQSTVTVFELYGSIAEAGISPEEYANLLDLASPGAKAKLIEMGKSKMIATAPQKYSDAIKDPNVKKLYDWAVAQA